MKRRLMILLVVFTITVGLARAQNWTAVTATHIQDVSGTPLASGRLCFQGTDKYSQAIPFKAGAGGQVMSVPVCTTITSGAIGSFQVPNPAQTDPQGIFYTITITPSGQPSTVYKLVQWSGGTFNFDNYSPAPGAVVPPGGGTLTGNYTIHGNLSVTGTISGTVASPNLGSRHLSPATLASGAGTEASPYTYGDSTGAIQTVINDLAADRGGKVVLDAGRYNVTAPDGVRIRTPALLLEGAPGGFNVDPNGQYEGVAGTKIHTTTHGVKLGASGAKLGGIQLRDLYLWGPGATGGSEGVAIDNPTDQPKLEKLNISGFEYGIYASSVTDAAHVRSCSLLSDGYGVYYTPSAIISYSAFDMCAIGDNTMTGFYLGLDPRSPGDDNAWGRLVNSTLVRNATTFDPDGANVYLGSSFNLLSGDVIRSAGYNLLTRSQVAADGVRIKGSYNLLNGNVISDNLNGCGVRVASGGVGNIIMGNSMKNNLLGGIDSDICFDAGSHDNFALVPGAAIIDHGADNVWFETGKGGNVGLNTHSPTAKWEVTTGTDQTLMRLTNLHYSVGVELNSLAAGGRNWAFSSTGPGHPCGVGMFAMYDIRQAACRAFVTPSGTLALQAPAPATSTAACYDTSTYAGFSALASCTSLRRFKTHIRPLHGAGGLSALGEVNLLHPVSYQSKTNGRSEIGFIAEDVNKIDSRLSTFDKGGELQGVMYDHMTAVLVKAIQEQQAEIESLKKEIVELRTALNKR